MEAGEVRGEEQERVGGRGKNSHTNQATPPLVFSWFGEEEGETR